MDAKTLTLLEYDQILQLLAAQAVTGRGKELALSLHPQTEREAVEAALAETEEGVRLLEQGGLPWGGLVDVRPVLQRARLGGLLAPEELLAVASTAEALERLKGALAHRGADFPLLSAQARAINVDPRLGREIRRCLTEGGEVDDGASPELGRLRARLRTVQNRVRERLEELVRSAEVRRYLQEPVVTVRNGRLVLPVRQECRGQVPGVVHDASASGATLFVEPLAVVELNNQARTLAAREREEVERILRVLSDLVRAQADLLSESLERAARLDLSLAKARLAAAQGAVRPRLNTCGRVNLHSARHPLLTGEVVPIDLRLGEEFDLLVLTGPNTGGKTVTLKT
ncbi:MAG: endonuclease MutS2, partial [Bacillota bacterium]|nr:endonuclease MutS2 [Bacillota bacterium]